jgi:hypothetical protein
MENGTIEDPGGIAVQSVNEIVKTINPEKSSSGGVFVLGLGLLIILLGRRGFIGRLKY